MIVLYGKHHVQNCSTDDKYYTYHSSFVFTPSQWSVTNRTTTIKHFCYDFCVHSYNGMHTQYTPDLEQGNFVSCLSIHHTITYIICRLALFCSLFLSLFYTPFVAIRTVIFSGRKYSKATGFRQQIGFPV